MLDPTSRPTSRQSTNLVNVNGTPIEEMGKGVFEVNLGPIN